MMRSRASSIVAWFSIVGLALNVTTPATGEVSDQTVTVGITRCEEARGATAIWLSGTPTFDVAGEAPIASTNEATVSVAAPGGRFLLASADGCALRAVPIDSGRVNVVLGPGRTVAFALSDGDGPVVGTIERVLANGVRVLDRSDKDGLGVMRGLEAERRRISVVTESTESTHWIEREARRIELTVPPVGQIRGRVVDDDGRPVPKPRLLLLHETARAVTTAADGSFLVKNLRAGRYTLEVSAERHRAERVDLVLERRQTAVVDVRLTRGPRVSVTFADLAGEPVVNPRLEVESNSPLGFALADLLRPGRAYTGDSHGRVEMTDLPAGAVQLVLNRAPFVRMRLPPLDTTTLQGDLDLGTVLVDEGASLDVSVTDSRGTPQSQEAVRLDHGPGLSPLSPDRRSTDAEGIARFTRLGPGRYRIRVGGDERPGGSTPWAQDWFVVSATDRKLTRTFTRHANTVTVTAVSAAGPLSHRPVAVTPADWPEEASQVEGFVVQTPTRIINTPFVPGVRGVTDQNGQVSLPGISEGPVRVSVALDYSRWSQIATPIGDDASVTVWVPELAVDVSTRDRDSYTPVPARLSWIQAASTVKVEGASGPDGRARLEGLPTGAGILTATHPSYRNLRLELADPAEIPAQIELQQAPARELRVSVLDEMGTPVSDASAEFTQPRAPGWKRVALSRADGALTFENLAEGEGQLLIRHPAMATRHVTVRDAERRVTVRMLPGLRRTLRLLDDGTGGPAGEFRIALVRDDGTDGRDVSADVMPRVARVGDDVDLGRLGDGRYLALVTLPGGRTTECRFAVPSSPPVVECEIKR